MTIDDFEDHIEPKILERGQDYCVENIEQLDAGEFCAEVQGSEMYEVYVRFRGKEIETHSCTCPYDWSNECKHFVAVLYYIVDMDMLNTKPDTALAQKFQKAVQEPNEQELRDFVFRYIKQNKAFREDFLEIFGEEEE